MSAGRRLLFVVNNPAFFMSHRLPVAPAAQRAGYDVHVATMDGPAVADIQALGMTHHAIPMTRSGKHPLQELGTLLALIRLFRRLRPQVVHLVTIKPVLYGGIAARLARVPGMVAAISGLGFVFLSNSLKMRLVRAVVARLYRIALGHGNSRVIFQNASDRDLLKSLGAVRDEQVVMIRGAGVDLAEYRASPEPPEPPVVVTMVARLLRDKGVNEFVEAARLLRARRARVHAPGGRRGRGQSRLGDPAGCRGVADGGLCPGPGRTQRRAGALRCLAYRGAAVLSRGAAEVADRGGGLRTGRGHDRRAGCRDAIEPGKTGLLVPVRDAGALADAIARLAADPALRHAMGATGRALAEREFNIERVARIHVDLYDALSA